MPIDKSYIEHLKEAEALLERINSLQESGDINNAMSDRLKLPVENLEKALEKLREVKKNADDLFNGNIGGTLGATVTTLGDNLGPVIERFRELKKLEKEINAVKKEKDTLETIAPQQRTQEQRDRLNIANQELANLTHQQTINENIIAQHGVTKDAVEEVYNKHLELNREANQYVANVQSAEEELKNVTAEIKKSHDAVKTLDNNWIKFKYSVRSTMSLFKNTINTIADGTKYWREQEGAIAKVSNTLGLSKKELGEYRQYILETSVDTQALYAISSEGLIKLQQGYDEATNKAIRFNEEQIHAQAQLSTLMGESESIAYTSDIDKLGVGIGDARDLMSELYKTAKSQGITSTKASQDFVKNLKVAQKYNFKGGLENLKEMTVYTAKMKVNLESIGQIADKISNPEGAIETAAKLQVLGGSFSSLANPLTMLYESLEDVGSLSERVSNMFDGMGSFDKELGEIRIGGMDRQRIKAAAEAMGVSYDEALDIARERIKRNQIEQDIQFNPNLDTNQVDLLKTLAQFNKKSGQFEVSTFNEETQKFEGKSISEIRPEDIEKLRGDEQDIKSIVENTFGVNARLDRLIGVTNASKAKVQERWWGNTAREKINDATTAVQNHSEEIGTIMTVKNAIETGFGGLMTIVESIRAILLGASLLNNAGALKGKISNIRSSTARGARGVMNSRGWGGAGTTLASGKSLMRGFGIGTIASIGGEGLDYWSENLKAEGNENGAAAASIGGSILKGAGMGAMFGPWGAAIGAGAGALWGIVENWDKVKEAGEWFVDEVVKPVGNILLDIGKFLWNWIIPLGSGKNYFKLIKSVFTGEKVNASLTGGVELNDGVVGRRKILAHPDDSMMFAKTGGVFDKMFDNIIPKIDNLYDLTKSNRGNFKELYSSNSTSVREMYESALNSSIIGKETLNSDVKSIPVGDTKTYFKEINENLVSNSKSSRQEISFTKPLEINLNGTLKLDTGNGKSVDLDNMIRNNPSLIKALTKMISDEISSTVNGGRVYKEGQRNTNLTI